MNTIPNCASYLIQSSKKHALSIFNELAEATDGVEKFTNDSLEITLNRVKPFELCTMFIVCGVTFQGPFRPIEETKVAPRLAFYGGCARTVAPDYAHCVCHQMCTEFGAARTSWNPALGETFYPNLSGVIDYSRRQHNLNIRLQKKCSKVLELRCSSLCNVIKWLCVH